MGDIDDTKVNPEKFASACRAVEKELNGEGAKGEWPYAYVLVVFDRFVPEA